jgi:hypothetical protein
MSYIDHYLRHIEERALPELRRQLEPLWSDKAPISERKSRVMGWMDTTGRQIALLVRAIEDYEDFLASHRTHRSPWI